MLRMRLALLFLLVSFAASMPFEKTNESIEVEVREVLVEDESMRTKRNARMARRKMFNFNLKNETVILDLTLNELVRDNAPMYVSENGDFKKWERENTDEQYAFYQDQESSASVMVRCKADLCKPLGTFSFKGKQYRIDLSGQPIESTSLITPVPEPPNMVVSREGDMVILKINPAQQPVQNQTQVTTPSMSQSSKPDLRSKRAIPSGADIVEIMVYTDEVICNRFITLNNGDKNAGLEATRFYYALLINEMDTVYQPFKTHPNNTAGLDIRLFFSGIIISCSSTTSPWSGIRSSSSTDLSYFARWQRNQKSTYSLKYDIAMGISGKTKGSTLGIAYVSAVCDSLYGANVVYETPSATWLMTTSAHELGHNLGADHDEDVGCPLGYIMSAYATTATEATASTQYQFTSCTVRDIQSTITGLGSTRCTLDYNFNGTVYDDYRAGAIGGDVLSLNYQCKVYFGSASVACLTNSSTMCYRGVTCQTSTGCNGRLHLVKEYTDCSAGKWCVKGQCVNKGTSGTNALGDCFLYKTCVRQNRVPVGDGCCQGSVITNCCVLGRRQTSCYAKAPCPSTSG